MTDAMIDIETLGTDAAEWPVIVSIGAVTFDDDGVGEEFFASVDIEDAQDCGLTIDAGTVLWWLEQSADAREQLSGGEDLERALRDLRSFIQDCDAVWANSPRFDCAILRAGYEAVGMTAPWSYWDERDYRTMREELDQWPDRDQSGTAHDALGDARYQARCLVDALQEVANDE